MNCEKSSKQLGLRSTFQLGFSFGHDGHIHHCGTNDRPLDSRLTIISSDVALQTMIQTELVEIVGSSSKLISGQGAGFSDDHEISNSLPKTTDG